MNNSELIQLQEWFQSQLNGDWEHAHGISIETLDNPGWHLKIELKDTDLEARKFIPENTDINADDWYTCKVEKEEFHGFCSPQHLATIINVFNEWAK
jgi:hypothetical protein